MTFKMAPNLINEISVTSVFYLFFLCTSIVTIVGSQKYLDEKEPCNRPYCYKFLRRNSSNSIFVKANESSGRTAFCYEGLQPSLIHLWANPVLRTTKEFPSNSDEAVKFVTFYGSSLLEAEQRSDAAVNAILQNWMMSVQSVRLTEDFSLSAFNSSCIIIDSNVNYRARVDVRAVDFWFLLYFGTGLILFFSAKTWSRNTTLHYGSGVTVGVLASVLILLYILSRFLPSKLKSVCYILMAMGTSASLWALQSLSELISESMLNTLMLYWHYILAYLITMSLLSFAVVYRYGPVSDPRTLNLIQWLLQSIGLILIYNSTQIREVSVALIIVTLVAYNFPRVLLSKVFDNQPSRNLWYKFFPPKIKLLTEDEYIQQGNVHTRMELEKLRDYCRSPECQSWKVISRLNSPHRFADFIMNGTWHISAEEEGQHAGNLNSEPGDNDTHSDTESELTFVLGNPNMRVTLTDLT